MADKTDEEIALAVQDGNSESFGILVERYEGKMKRYARKFLLSHQDAEDLVQEVLIKAYINIKSFDPGRKFSPWIYRIAHNEFINALGRKKREPLSLFDPDIIFPHPVAKETSDTKAYREEIKKMLDRSIEKLNLKYREPLVLYYLEEMGYQEIAEILRIPVSTVGVRLKRGKEALEKIMKNKLD